MHWRNITVRYGDRLRHYSVFATTNISRCSATEMLEHSDRPYFENSIVDLESLSNAHWADCGALIHVALELFHRKTQRAISLRTRLLERISELIAQGFPWPSTDAEPTDSNSAVFIDAPTTGMLGYLGYRVGVSGVATDDRLALLSTIYTHRLPQINSADYMLQWCEPSTSIRLRKMADSIAAFVRNAKRRASPPRVAIDEWEADLQYLYTKHYLGCYNFFWPNTD